MRFADKTEIYLGPDAARAPLTNQLSRLAQPAILAGKADRTTALGVDRRDELFVDRSGQDHLDHFHRLAVGHSQAVDDASLDAEPLQHMGDLWPAAVHDDRIDPVLLQQHDVARERILRDAIGHGVAAIFDDQGVAGIAAHIGQRLRQDRSFDRRVRVGLRSECGRAGIRVHRTAHSIAIVRWQPQNWPESRAILQCRDDRARSSDGSLGAPRHGGPTRR